MTRIPENLATISDARLVLLDGACERELKREIDRVSNVDTRFARVLRDALKVEDEIERRRVAP